MAQLCFGEALNAATIRHVIGDGGFQAHLQDPNFILENIFRFPALYRNVTGRNLGSVDQIEAYLPAYYFHEFIKKTAALWYKI